MPDAAGNFKGQGYSAARAAGWERAFAPTLTRAELQDVDWGVHDDLRRRLLAATESEREVPGSACHRDESTTSKES